MDVARLPGRRGQKILVKTGLRHAFGDVIVGANPEFRVTSVVFRDVFNINGRDVQRKNVVNNVNKSSLWAP